MDNFGEELIIIYNYRIPWLIWIQLVIMFLFILLFYFFTFDHQVTASASSSYPATANSQLREDLIIKETGDVNETEDYSGKNITSVSHLRRPHHPCHFLGIIKQAFLKCLGLDYSSESSSNSNQDNEH